MKAITEVYRSNYLKSEDLPEGGEAVYTVRDAVWETFKNSDGEQEKLVLSLEETTRELVCNATNARMLAALLGTPKPDEWVGARVKLHTQPVVFAGRTVDAIRVKDAKPAAKATTRAAKAEPTAKAGPAPDPTDPGPTDADRFGIDSDELPNWRAS